MKLDVAKFRLMNNYPFFGVLLYNTPVEEHLDVPTMGTDGEKIYYNKKFWNSMSNSEQLGVLCHELGHLFLLHPLRRQGRDLIATDPQSGQSVHLWNLAADYVVNDLIKQAQQASKGSGINITLPKHALVSSKYHNKITEEVYTHLAKTMKKMTKQKMQDMIGKFGRSGSHKKWGKMKRAKAKELQGKWKNVGQQAMNHAKEKGNLPAGLQRLYDSLEPKENWRRILMNYAQPFNNDYSFNPSDRRFLGEDFILPDIKDGQQIDWIAIAVDTSGSISPKELNAFIGEVKGIMSSFDKIKVKLTFCDTNSTPFIELEEFESDKVKPIGGGGTSFIEPFKLVEKEHSPPLCFLYFTDLWGDFPSIQPLYDTIWIYTNDGGSVKTPFGKRLPYNI